MISEYLTADTSDYSDYANFTRLLYEKNGPVSLREIYDHTREMGGEQRFEMRSIGVVIEIELIVGELDESKFSDYSKHSDNTDEAGRDFCYYKVDNEFSEKHRKVCEFHYMYRDYIEQFWRRELKTLLEDVRHEMTLKDVALKMGESFLNYYQPKPYLPFAKNYIGSDAGIRFHETRFDEFLLRNTDLFYLNTDSFYNKPEDKLVGLTKWNDVTSKAIKELSLHLPGILRAVEDQTLSFDDLHHRVNRLPIKLGIPKPFSLDLILRSLKVVPKRFEIDDELGSVTLCSDAQFLQEYFLDNVSKISDFNPNNNNPAIIAFVYTEHELRHELLSGYVNMRPVLLIQTVNDLGKSWELFKKKTFGGELYQASKLLTLLYETDPDDEGAEKVQVAVYYEADAKSLQSLVTAFINRYQPIFNIADSDRSLFFDLLLNEEIYVDNDFLGFLKSIIDAFPSWENGLLESTNMFVSEFEGKFYLDFFKGFRVLQENNLFDSYEDARSHIFKTVANYIPPQLKQTDSTNNAATQGPNKPEKNRKRRSGLGKRATWPLIELLKLIEASIGPADRFYLYEKFNSLLESAPELFPETISLQDVEKIKISHGIFEANLVLIIAGIKEGETISKSVLLLLMQVVYSLFGPFFLETDREKISSIISGLSKRKKISK